MSHRLVVILKDDCDERDAEDLLAVIEDDYRELVDRVEHYETGNAMRRLYGDG